VGWGGVGKEGDKKHFYFLMIYQSVVLENLDDLNSRLSMKITLFLGFQHLNRGRDKNTNVFL